MTVDIDSMGPGLQLLGGQFSNFLLGKVSLEFKLHGMSIFHDIRYCMKLQSHGWVRWSYTYCVCSYDLDPILGRGHGQFELPTIARNCTLPGLSPPPLSRESQN